MSFLNPQLLFWTALVSVPIIIYLINRHRYQRRPWAAMEFLLRAMKRTRRRLQIQNLLLLIIRTAAVLFIVLSAARPVLRHGPPGLAPDSNHNWILVVDTSYSMGYQEGAQSFFDQTRGTISEMLDASMKPGDRVALMTLADDPRILLAPIAITGENRDRVRRELEALRLSSGAVDLGASFSVLDELCQKHVTELGDPEAKRIVIFSDFQRRDWLVEDSPRDPTILGFIDKIQKEYGEFFFARVGQREATFNLAVTQLSVTPPLIARDVWVELAATIQNFGIEDAAHIDFSIQIDPDLEAPAAEPQMGSVITVPAGGQRVVRLPYKFEEPGYHTVVAELRSDGLVIDNRRYLVARVEDRVDVLLVDGEPAADPLDRETFHLEVALEPEDDALGSASGRFTPFEPRYLSFDQLGDVDWSVHAVVVLANVPEVREAEARALKRYVSEGGSLIVFLGDMIRPAAYNTLFHDDGESLLPVALGEVHGNARFPVLVEVADAEHPVASYFSKHEDVTHLRLIPFSSYYLVAAGGETPPLAGRPGIRVPFRYTDLERNPAVFDNGYGKGRVLWVTSSADVEWNGFPRWPDFVVFLYESMSYLVRFGAGSMNLAVGDVFHKRYDDTQFASQVILHSPASEADDFKKTRTLTKIMEKPADGAGFEITHEETTVPGLYRLDLQRPNVPEPDSVEHFAVNVATEEGDLHPMAAEDFEAHVEGLKFQVLDAPGTLREASRQQEVLRGREYWHWLLSAVLALLVLETVLAWLFGRRAR
jgi:hypothetical protein